MSDDITKKLVSVIAEAADDIRHKVIEQAWSGQEQTGFLQNIYGTDFASGSDSTAQGSTELAEGQRAAPIDPKDSYVRTEPRPNEIEGWWQGEYENSYGAAVSDNHTPHNGWGIGQDAAQTRQALAAEQNAPEIER